MIRAGIVGVTGYGGRELIRLLMTHPEVEVAAVTSTTLAGQRLDQVHPGFTKVSDLTLESFDASALAGKCDIVFLAVPATESMTLGAELRGVGVRVIDIGPDYRLKDTEAYREYYGAEHVSPEALSESVYGLVPHNRDALKTANVVAVPGCYPISAILPLKPLVDATTFEVPPIIDSISGISGAGRSLKQAFHYPEMNENVWAYKLTAHQHTPEIEQELGGKTIVQFSPHVGPYTRGILSTITVRPTTSPNLDALYAHYEAEPFVRVLGEGVLPEIANVRATNFCDIGWVNDPRTGNMIIVSAIDNLMGGTAGMALQCMNLMFNVEETTGLVAGGLSI